ncbi:MAG: hypothetical protein LBJ46_06245 [Planctomycetota bacterium]|jgi:hypothetical protein|nr:hypothetical protein [Planctomycetota bacterium]
MPDAWSNIVNNLGGGRPRRGGQSSLPTPGSVVMASVEEDHGDGVYTIRWGGNRLAVSSQVKLSTGSSLILKAELSPEGKTVLVVQGPALPSRDLPIIAASYGPPSKQPQESAAGQEQQTSPVGTEEAPASGTRGKIDGGWLSGAVLKPLFEQLPDFSKQSDMLLKMVARELERLAEETAGQTSAEQDEPLQSGADEAGGAPSTDQEKAVLERPAEKLASDPAMRLADAVGFAKMFDSLKEMALRAAVAADPEIRVAVERPTQTQAAETATPEAPAATLMGEPAQPQPAQPLPPQQQPGQPSAEPLPAQPGQAPEARPTIPTSDYSLPPVVDAGDEARPAQPGQSSVQPQPAQPRQPEQPVPPEQTPPVQGTEVPPPRPERTQSRQSGAQAQQTSATSTPIPGNVLADALRQLAKTAELPLGGKAAEIARHAGGGRTAVPEAVADKAAAILLTAAGLTPGPATVEAAKALMERNAPVDRGTVQLLLSLAAGSEGTEREAILKAAARLIAHDVPVAQPVVSGLADVLSREAGITKLLESVDAALRGPVPLPEVKPLADAAREMLAMLSVDLDSADASAMLERFLSSFGRETLARVLELVETAAQAALESHSDLPKIDAALTAILARLNGETLPERPVSALTPEGENAVLPDGTVRPEVRSGEAALPPDASGSLAQPQPDTPGDTSGAPGAPTPSGSPPPRGELAHPGVNTPSVELLKPGGPLEAFLADNAGGSGGGKTPARDVDAAMADLLSNTLERRAQATRELATRSEPFLRGLAARLMDTERAVIRTEPFLTRLAEAANSLRELGRQLIAVKAENIAGQDRTPGVMLAEVPFKLNEGGGDGRMQMFYRKGGSAKGGWSSRVILDLNTTVLGQVLGDMRFFGKDMVLNMFVDNKGTADFLARAGGELADKLLGKGFRLKSRFFVLPPPPEITADRPEQLRDARETDVIPAALPTGIRTRKGRLDTEA